MQHRPNSTALVIRLDSRQTIQIRPNLREKTLNIVLCDANGKEIAEANEDAAAFLKGSAIVANLSGI